MSLAQRTHGTPSGRVIRTPWRSARGMWTGPQHRLVHRFRLAAEDSQSEQLASLLHPDVRVVVDRGQTLEAATRVVGGLRDATSLLIHGLAFRQGTSIDELSINGQPGLMLSNDGRPAAAINLDFTDGLIKVVWIRLHPERLRHWNHT